jgi:hypothetical protein
LDIPREPPRVTLTILSGNPSPSVSM